MSIIAIIFARGGSKGLPKKNIKLLGNLPLIAWSIKHALSVNRIERVIVSTDSEEIASLARKYGAETPFIRPADLADDNTPEWLAWSHALSHLIEENGKLPDLMVSLPPTAPLRMPIDIENCLDEYEKGDADAVVTVTDAHRNPYFNMVKEKVDGTVDLVITPNNILSRRQDSPIVYDLTTVCYVLKPEFVMNCKALFEGRIKAVHVPKERAIDIDTLLDFQIAECLLNTRNQNHE